MKIALRPAAIAVSVALHSTLLIQMGGSTNTINTPTHSESITRLSFSQPAPVPENIPAPENEPEPVKDKPEPIPEKKSAKKVQQKPKEVQPKPEAPQMAASAASATTDSAVAPQLDPGLIESRTKAYLASVITHIEQHKWYPKSARRRGIEGEVEVEFLLLADGSARAVAVNNGPETLLAAARKTVERAMPMPAPPAEIHCPIKCSFRMQFALNAI